MTYSLYLFPDKRIEFIDLLICCISVLNCKQNYELTHFTQWGKRKINTMLKRAYLDLGVLPLCPRLKYRGSRGILLSRGSRQAKSRPSVHYGLFGGFPQSPALVVLLSMFPRAGQGMVLV